MVPGLSTETNQKSAKTIEKASYFKKMRPLIEFVFGPYLANGGGREPVSKLSFFYVSVFMSFLGLWNNAVHCERAFAFALRKTKARLPLQPLDLQLAPQLHHTVGRQLETLHCTFRTLGHPGEQPLAPARHAGVID